MKRIFLTKGAETIVNDEDFEYLNQFRWQLDSDGYAVRHNLAHEGKRGSKKRMHRVILSTPKGLLVDHVNGDRLDNRRENLRNCTFVDNARNAKRHASNASGFKGVYWNKREKKWKGHIRTNNKSIHLGYFKSARLNFK